MTNRNPASTRTLTRSGGHDRLDGSDLMRLMQARQRHQCFDGGQRLVAFALVLTASLAGVAIRDRLPKHHLTDETKNLVSVSTAVVASVSALVLGLLISTASTSFTRLGGEVTAISAPILRLDHILLRYGPDTQPARNAPLQYAEQYAADLYPDDPANVRLSNSSTYELLQRLEDMLLALKPANPRDQ